MAEHVPSSLRWLAECGLLCFVEEVPALTSLVNITRFPGERSLGHVLAARTRTRSHPFRWHWKWPHGAAQVPAMALGLSQPVTPCVALNRPRGRLWAFSTQTGPSFQKNHCPWKRQVPPSSAPGGGQEWEGEKWELETAPRVLSRLSGESRPPSLQCVPHQSAPESQPALIAPAVDACVADPPAPPSAASLCVPASRSGCWPVRHCPHGAG